MDDCTWSELDRRLAGELSGRLPNRLFDAHAHLWRQADFAEPATGIWTGGGAEVTPDVWREHLARQVGAERLAGALFIPVPSPALNPPEEVELADRLCEIHPWSQQARFARCGGEACAVAVRIARATTDRSVIAICGYHGWQDWYLAANLGASDALRGHLLPGLDPLGVPGELRGTTVAFPHGDRTAFQTIIDRHGARLAAVIMEPCRSHDPEPGYLAWVRDAAHRAGALLIFDEITIGWRLVHGGAHLKYGVHPDLAVFAKALGNGHPMAAVIGTPAAMAGAHASFISSTYWTESIGPAAALATLQKLRQTDAAAHVAAAGAAVQRTWLDAAGRAGLPVKVGGFPCLAHFTFDHPQADVLRTLFTQQMLARGFLAGTGFYPTLAHTE